MKLVEMRNGWMLEDIMEDRNFNKTQIRFKNLAGRQTNPKYNPSHVLVLWIDDPDMARFMKDELMLNVSEREIELKDENGDPQVDKNGNPMVLRRASVQLKAYPKMRPNRISGKDEPTPRIMLKTPSTGRSVRLDIDNFGLFDSTRLISADVRFHTWEYEEGKCVACIDELWAIVDESAGEVDGSYLMDKYGYSEANEMANVGVAEEEDVPW